MLIPKEKNISFHFISLSISEYNDLIDVYYVIIWHYIEVNIIANTKSVRNDG